MQSGMDALEGIIEQLERQKTAIENALSALRGIGGIEPSVASDATNRRSLAQKSRWAATRAAEGADPKKRKGGLSPAGRKRLAENMRKRWAAKRTAAQAKRKAA